MVLLHGINADARDWEPVVARLPDEYRVVAPDLLGHGDSPRPPGLAYTTEEHVAALREALGALDVDEPFALVGYSLGGDIALRYAAEYPDEVRRLFMLSAPFYLAPDEFSKRGFAPRFLYQIMVRRFWKVLRRLPERNPRVFEQLATPGARLYDFAAASVGDADVRGQYEIMTANIHNTIEAADFARDLPRLTMPAVFALGVRDPIVSPDETPALKRIKPDLEVRRIVGLTADHLLLKNLPDTVAAEIMRDEIDHLTVGVHEGSGEPPTVFLHGIEGSSRYWGPIARGLALGREVLTMDLLGFGRSPRPLSLRYSMDDHVFYVRATVRRFLGRDRRFRLVAHSMGAMIALGYAARHPDEVVDLTLFDPPVFLDEEDRARLLTRDLDRDQQRFVDAYRVVRDRLRSTLDSGFLRRAIGDSYEERTTPSLRSLAETVERQDVPADLAAIGCPVRIFYGTGDVIVVPAFLEALARADSDVEVAAFDGFGHNLPTEDALLAVRLIEPGVTLAEEAAVARAARGSKVRDEAAGVRDLLSSANSVIAIRGAIMLAAGLLLTFWANVPERWLVVGFAGYVLFESATTIIGAVGLRGAHKKWLSFGLTGAVGVVIGLYLLLQPQFSIALLLLVVASWAALRGVVDLYVAWRVTATASPRWFLVAEGLVALAAAALIFFLPQHGLDLVLFVVKAYLIASGALLLFYATTSALLVWQNRG
jgi:pimeloyl-ACP methyl ester carboxylesterase/uncharacterized membrane protein HdeD (DUF308 family)